MLAQEQPLPDKIGASATATSVWKERSGNHSPESTRHLLVLTTHSIGNRIADSLRRTGWSLHFAENATQASALVTRYDILVGLNIVWPDDTRKHGDETREILFQYRTIRWVGAFSREQIKEEPIINLVAEYLYDFLSLPLDPAHLDVILGHAYGMAVIANRYRENQSRERVSRFGMVGASPSMLDLFHAIERAAQCDLPVVISGETGTGKKTVAKAIHASSIRGDGPFVILNCTDLTAQQLQAEIDAFTTPNPTGIGNIQRGNRERRAGRTLFLDEVSELPSEAQRTLLRFLEDVDGFRSPTGKPTWSNIRLVCAAKRNLEKLAHNDEFHLGLYYRLRALVIEVPSLKDRQSDVRVLAQHFLEEFRQHDNSLATGFSQDALTAIERYEWPGNVRELRNRIHQAALCSRAAFITPADLRLADDSHEESAPSLQEARDVAEKQAIWLALQRNRQNLSRAAKDLRVSRMTLYRLLSKHHMSRNI